RNEREIFDVRRVLEQVEHREQPAPGIAAERQPLNAEMRAQRVEVGDMLPPTHGGVARDGRLTATPLIVIEELAPVRQEVVLRQQIIVMCAWSAVENDHEGSGTDAAGEEPNAVAFN